MDQAQKMAMEIENRRRENNQQMRFGLLKLAFDALKEQKQETTPEKIKEWANLLKNYVLEG